MAPTALSLTANEQKLLQAVIAEMGSMPQVNFDKVAGRVGVAYGRNARSSFKKLWEKLQGDSAGASSDGATTTPSKGTRGATKKTVDPRKTPVKANAGGPKAKGKKTAKKDDSEADSDDDNNDNESHLDEDFFDAPEDHDADDENAKFLGMDADDFRKIKAEDAKKDALAAEDDEEDEEESY